MADFCTQADVEAFLQVTVPAAKVASVNRAIAEATEAIRNYCHQYIEEVANETITLDCAGGVRLFLPELPVSDVSVVVEDGELLVAGADEDYQLGQHGILYRVDQDWESGIQIVEVTYTHGYDPIPDDVVAVCTRAAARAYQAGLKAAEMAAIPGVQAKTLGDFSVQFGGEAGAAGESVLGASAAPMLLRSEQRMLDRYRYVAQ
jgi:hypothetical protein